MIALLTALLLTTTTHHTVTDTTVVTHHHHSRPCPCGHKKTVTKTHRVTSDNEPASPSGAGYDACGEPGATVGGFISRDDNNGPTLLGLEVMGRTGPLGIRVSFGGGDNLDRTTVDGLLFYCVKPVQIYGGLGLVSDCVGTRHTVTPAKRDPPSLVAGVESVGENSVFGEYREIFGDDSHGAVAVGLRHKL